MKNNSTLNIKTCLYFVNLHNWLTSRTIQNLNFKFLFYANSGNSSPVYPERKNLSGHLPPLKLNYTKTIRRDNCPQPPPNCRWLIAGTRDSGSWQTALRGLARKRKIGRTRLLLMYGSIHHSATLFI